MELQKINLQKKESLERKTKGMAPKIIGLVLALALGLATGFLVKNKVVTPARNSGPVVARNVPDSGLKEGDIIGVQDTQAFKDSVTGVLQKGGLDGEGSHRLLRPGGTSQMVYLTSSIIDLDDFVGHQVTIWGETFKGQKAGWLMDVGRVKVEKLDAPDPE